MKTFQRAYEFVRDVYGVTVPSVLLAVILFCMIFLREAALFVIVLPCAAILIATLAAAYFILGRGETRSPAEERLFRLLAAKGKTARYTLPEIAQSLSAPGEAAPDQAAAAEALSRVYTLALLSLFWDKESGTVYLPARGVCPKCGAPVAPAQIYGNCATCGIAYVVSERKKPFYRAHK